MSAIKVQSSDVLTRLYEVFDELGMVHRFSEELGEFEVKSGDTWFSFFVDPDVLREEREEQDWLESSYREAEMFWNE